MFLLRALLRLTDLGCEHPLLSCAIAAELPWIVFYPWS